MTGLMLQGVDSWSAVIQLLVRGKTLRDPQSRAIKCSALYFDFTPLLHMNELQEGARPEYLRAYVTKASDQNNLDLGEKSQFAIKY